MMKKFTFLIPILWSSVLYGHIIHEETCTDEMNVSEQELWKIGMRTCSKTWKYLIAHNFFNFDHNIGMLHLKMIVLMRGIQLNKNFSHSSYPVLTTIQNDKKFHIFEFKFSSHPFYMGISYMKRHVQMR